MNRPLIALATLLLVACQTKQSQPKTGPASTPAAVDAKSTAQPPQNFPGLKYYKWQLTSIVSPEKADPVQLPKGVAVNGFHMWFNKEGISVRGSCNRMGGYVELQPGNTFKLSGFRMTQMGCGHPLDQADDIMASVLSDAHGYNVAQKVGRYHLYIRTRAGVLLDFIGLPTLELEHGESTRRFIDIEMSQKPCPVKPCLKWREFIYAEDYSKVPVSETWQTDYPGIQGFEPEPKHNYIIRLKEYQTPRGKLWVHDLTVGVEIQASKTEPE